MGCQSGGQRHSRSLASNPNPRVAHRVGVAAVRGARTKNLAETEGACLNSLFSTLADFEEQLKPFRHELLEQKGRAPEGPAP